MHVFMTKGQDHKDRKPLSSFRGRKITLTIKEKHLIALGPLLPSLNMLFNFLCGRWDPSGFACCVEKEHGVSGHGDKTMVLSQE